MPRLVRVLKIVLALSASAVVLYLGPSSVAVVAAMAFVVSTLLEPRSTVWVILTGALLFLAPLAALAAVALASSTGRHDLRYQGVAALRRMLASALSPLLALGAAAGAFRLGRSKQALWWLIGWAPPVLLAVLNLAFFHTFAITSSLGLVAAIGVLLSLDPGPTAATNVIARTRAADETTKRAQYAPGRTVVAQGGGTTDWRDIIDVPEAFTGRQAQAPAQLARDGGELVPELNS